MLFQLPSLSRSDVFLSAAAARLLPEVKEEKGAGAVASEIIVEEGQEEEKEEESGPSVPDSWQVVAAANTELTFAIVDEAVLTLAHYSVCFTFC